MKVPAGLKLRLDPKDEYTHRPEAARNYNESMYFNVYDPKARVGGWFRLGNRPNEGYAEMSFCLYLPDGRVAFMFKRAEISHNERMDAGGLSIDVIEPFKSLKVRYEGKACVMADPTAMADPKRAFAENPRLPVSMVLDYVGLSPMHGGELVNADGTPLALDPEKAFLRGHYEQHMAVKGAVSLDGTRYSIEGFGVRDKSWGPRFWQAVRWYRWLPMCFGPDFGMVISVTAGEEGPARPGGMVFEDGRYWDIEEARVEAEFDRHDYQTRLTAWCRTEKRAYEVEGRVMSLIPLRNRREAPDGTMLTTRITEGMTEYRTDGRVGYGLSEFLDQIVEGRAAGRVITA